MKIVATAGCSRPLGSCYLPAYTDRKEFCIFDGDAIRWIGVVRLAAGGALRLWPVWVLGRRFSGGWWRSNRGTRWSRAVCRVSSATRVISGMLINSLG